MILESDLQFQPDVQTPRYLLVERDGTGDSLQRCRRTRFLSVEDRD